MSADPDTAQPERRPDEIERPASVISVETTETETVHDVEKALPTDAVPAVSTSGEPTGAEADPGVVGRTLSRISSTRSKAVTIVPRSQRRGLFARFAITPEVERPYEYKNSTKWWITATIALATLAAPLGSSIFYRKFAQDSSCV